MRVMDNRQKLSDKIRKPGGTKRYSNRVYQLSATESEETVLKESQRKTDRYECSDKYFTSKPLHYELNHSNYPRITSPNSRPQSSISNFSNYSIDGDIKEKDLECLVKKLSMISHPLCRVNAINSMIDAPIAMFVNCATWHDLSEQIKICLADKDLIIFRAAFKLTSNIISNSDTIKEGFLVLLEGSLQISHKKASNHNYKQKNLEINSNFYNLDKNKTEMKSNTPFTVLSMGIKFNNPQQKRILQMGQLMIQAQKQMSKYWLRWKEGDTQEILENYVDFLSIQIEYMNSQRDKINLLHILSILDPNAKWLECWLFNIHVAKKLIKIIEQNYIYFSFIVHIVTEYIQNPPKLVPYEISKDKIINETQIKLCLFMNSLYALGHLLKHRKIHDLFPISTKVSKNLSIIDLLVLLINYLNENMCKTNSDLWYNSVKTGITEVVTTILCSHTDIMLNVINLVIKPLEKSSYSFSEEIKIANLKILKHIIPNIFYENIPKREVEIDDSLSPRITSSFIIKADYFKEQLPFIILNFFNKLLEYSNFDKKLRNTDNLADLLHICLSLMEMPNYTTLLTNSYTIDLLINCYKHMHKLSNSTNDVRLSNILQACDKILIKLSCNAVGQPKIENHFGTINILVKRLINKPKFSCLESNFMLLICHLGSCEDITKIIENHNLLEDVLLDFWSGIKDVGSCQYGSCLINNENKLINILNFIFSMSCNLGVVQSFTRCLFSAPSKSDLTTIEDHFPISLNEIMSHLSQSVLNQTFEELQNVDDVIQKSPTCSETNYRNACDCITSHYELSICFVALEILKALITNLDVMLFLNNKYKFQKNLLLAQNLNIKQCLDDCVDGTHELQEEKLGLSNETINDIVIVDELSLIRHQILLSSQYLGGPNESAPINFTLDKYLKDKSIPRLFAEWPEINCFKVSPSCSYFGRRNFLEEYLWKTRSNINDSFWLKKAREKLKISEDIKSIVLVELLTVVPKDTQPVIHLLELSMKNEFKNAKMFEEDFAAIDLIIGYGIDLNILQKRSYHRKNLTYMMQLCYKSLMPEDRIKFTGFDWFVGVVFLICKGNVIRCRKFLQMFICLPTAPFIWPKLGESMSRKNLKFGVDLIPARFAMMRAIEIIMEDIIVDRNILQLNGVSWTAITQVWIQQCFLNIIDWKQLIRLFACCILYPADFLAYYNTIIYKNLMSDMIIKHAARKDLWHVIKMMDMSTFIIDDHYPEIEEMRQKYQHLLLPLLHISQ